MVHCTFQANIIGWFIAQIRYHNIESFSSSGKLCKSAFETRKAAECVAVTAVTAVLAVRVIGARTVVAIMALKENNK